MANISCPTCISSPHVLMWCRGCGHKLTVAPLSYFLTSDVCVDELPREISQLTTNTYAQVKAPHSATAIPGTNTTTYEFVSVAQEVEHLVTSHGAFGRFQHVVAQMVWLLALLTVSCGCKLTAGGSAHTPLSLSQLHQPCQILFPSVNSVYLTHFCH